MGNKLHIVSLGCTKNLVDTEVMMGKLHNFELTDDNQDADVIIVNTCGFIDAAKEESINTVLTLDEERKDDSLLVMAGCLSERYKEELMEQIPEVDIFTGVGDYEQIDQLLAEKESRFSDEVYLIDGADRVVTGSTYHAYIKLSEGCNQACSFCAIPSFKGKLNSRSLDSIAKEVEALVAKGYYDFSFVSQDSSSYLRDKNIREGLSLLIQRIELIDGVKSARILYLYPSTTSMTLLKNIAKSKIFHNYFDMPIQHINDDMLRIMKRGFGKEKTLELLNSMRSLPNSFVRTSFIVGHPGETEEMFEEMCEFASSFGFDRINVFSYSDEETTSAYEMRDKIDEETIAKRAEILGEITDACLHKSLKAKVGTEIELVIDGESDEHEYLLSAKELIWAPDIDGEIYVNDRTDEIIDVLKKHSKNAKFFLNTEIIATKKNDGIFEVNTSKGIFKSKKLVVATGGMSYAKIGATDIGLKIAKSFDIGVKEFSPALVGMTVQPNEFWMKELSGLSCYVHIKVDNKVLKEEMLFAHKGISGPAVLSASLYWKKGNMSIDFLPNDDIINLIQNSKKLISSVIPLPKRLAKALLKAIDVKDVECKKITQQVKEKLQKLHDYSFAPAGNFGFTKAEASRGGVLADEINIYTMESNKVEGLYFIGEVADVTGELGGYNFQWAFSSGVVCAQGLNALF